MMEKQKTFFELATAMATRRTTARSLSTCKNYATALRSMQQFAGRRRSTLRDIDEHFIRSYERWLRQRGVSLNTISCYMRSLRAVYHQLGGTDDPFAHVYTGAARTEKRAVDVGDIRLLQQLELAPGTPEALARDMFLFSVYTLGMPFVDMAYLLKRNIRDGTIVYMRHKTHQRISVPLLPCMTDIISRYERRGRQRVFPIVSSRTTRGAYREYQSGLRRYNLLLKRLAHKAGITARLTSYVSRHTWASLAYSRGVDLAVISKALGHTNSHVTQVYIREINDDRIGEANHLIINALLG